MVQTRSVKMDKRIVEFELNFDFSFNYHKEVMKVFIQNLFAEFKEDMKKNIFSEKCCHQEERMNILESEKSMLQEQIISLNSAMCTSESNIE